MKIRLGKRLWLVGVIPLALSGCVTCPIAKNLQQQARPLTWSQVFANPGACQGTVVIWGGRIIQTVNDVNGGALYILKLPLDRSGKPRASANASGRFIASSKGFLDPEVYRPGRLVTAAGAIAGLETEPAQKTQYTYPAMAIKQIYVWPVERRYYYYPAWGWNGYYYPGWDWGWHPGWGVSWGWYYHGEDWDHDFHGGHWEQNGDWHYPH